MVVRVRPTKALLMDVNLLNTERAFARRPDGSAVVVDCQPLTRIKPRDAAAFETTRQACREVGWDYRLVCAPDPVLAANVRWLAGYRHPRNAQPEVTAALRE